MYQYAQSTMKKEKNNMKHQGNQKERNQTEFMNEYIDMGHMELVKPYEQQNQSSNVYYVPHFSIVREDAYTTKCFMQVFHQTMA